MAKNVTPIPATRNRFTESLLDSREKRKVAGYARVSTDSEEQASSYEAQMDYYRNYINSRSDWVFVDMYSDEGVTGTSTKSRDGFNKMVSDALDGKIDLIITKSVSRFARNTVDSLSTVRKLKENGIEIYFEKENIWTLDSKGELLITIMSSLAQEESRSISENTTWGTRKKMADGKFTVAYSRFLGYDKGPDGQLVINEEEAGIIRLIYRLFLEGYSYNSIATELTKRGILSPGGKKKWCHTTVMSILSNEKYKGDALLQKTYIEDFLTKKKKKNNGELTSYYINNDHEAIIEPRIFDLVQTEMKRRSKMPGKFRGKSVYMLKIKCGCCGGWYGIKIWHSNEKCRKTVYQCMQKYEGDVKCTTPHLMEKQIQSIFIKAVNIMIANRESVLEDASIIKERLCDVTLLERDLSRLKNEADIISKLIEKYERENASMAIGQEEYNRTRGELVERYKVAEAEVDAVKEKINDRRDKVIIMENFIEEMKKYTEFVTEFDAWMWSNLIDHITVFSRDNIQVNFRDGTNIPITIV